MKARTTPKAFVRHPLHWLRLDVCGGMTMMIWILVVYFGRGEFGTPAPGWQFATQEACQREAAHEHAQHPGWRYGCVYTSNDPDTPLKR